MLHRLSLALVVSAIYLSLSVSSVQAQTVVRFQTTVGDFDMVLNPTNKPVLQAHVDNMLHDVESEAYKSSWINRAADDFVLQMGGFYSHTKRVPIDILSTRPVATINPVPGEPAAENPGLSNTVGTVAMALPRGAHGTHQDGGKSSVFVNMTSNAFLDPDFTVFAAIPDMTTINKIMDLMQRDLTTDPNFGAGNGNLAFSDVPIDENGFQVFIRNAFVIEDTLAAARARAGVQSVMAASMSGANGGGASLSPPIVSGVVPEPATGLLFLLGLLAWPLRRRR